MKGRTPHYVNYGAVFYFDFERQIWASRQVVPNAGEGFPIMTFYDPFKIK